MPILLHPVRALGELPVLERNGVERPITADDVRVLRGDSMELIGDLFERLWGEGPTEEELSEARSLARLCPIWLEGAAEYVLPVPPCPACGKKLGVWGPPESRTLRMLACDDAHRFLVDGATTGDQMLEPQADYPDHPQWKRTPWTPPDVLFSGRGTGT